MKKKENDKLAANKDEFMNLYNKEKEILDSYSDVTSDEDKYKQIAMDEFDINGADEEEIEEYELDGINIYNSNLEEPMEKKIEEDIAEENEETEASSDEEIIIEDELKELEDIKNELEDDNYEDIETQETKKKKRKNKANTIINIIFVMIMILIILSALDVVMVVKYEKEPHFAIPVKTYDDGGSKEYIGLGYKVIKYSQVQGRRDTEVGSWKLKYNIDPITLDSIDLAIETNNNETETYKKYYKKFMKITGTLKSVDMDKNSMIISYIDEGGKYNLDIECSMETDLGKLAQLEVGKEVTVIGTMNDYKYKSKDNNATIKLKNCFAGQEQEENEELLEEPVEEQ